MAIRITGARQLDGLKSPALSEADIDAYRRDGYVVPDYRVPAATLEGMRQALMALQAANPHMTTDFILCPHLPDPSLQNVTGSPEWMTFATLPDILDMAEQLIGPDIILWGTTVFGKPSGTGKKTPWHQDANYWPMKPAHTCTAWIALDDATIENGCLQVIPGSHRNRRYYKHNFNNDGGATLNQELDAAEFDEAEAHPILLKAGQVSFHDSFLVHGSEPNRSEHRRAGFVVRLMPGACVWDRRFGVELAKNSRGIDFESRVLCQVRGKDLSGVNDTVDPATVWP